MAVLLSLILADSMLLSLILTDSNSKSNSKSNSNTDFYVAAAQRLPALLTSAQAVCDHRFAGLPNKCVSVRFQIHTLLILAL